MPTYFDEKQKTYYCKFYYQDYTGERKQKKKRGFKRQKDAKEWERNFLESQQGQPDMAFKNMIDLYLEDQKHRTRAITFKNTKLLIEKHIIPHFGNKATNKITPKDIRAWQNQIMKMGFSESYQKRLCVALSAIFNYAVRFHNLKDNPARIAGSIGSSKSRGIDFYTLDEYKQFIEAVDAPQYYTAFQILYWTGIRVGELLALTPSDFDFKSNILHITKTRQHINGMDVITPPKTEKSIRDILITNQLADCIIQYMKKNYGLGKDDYLFPFCKETLYREIRRSCKKTGIKSIRVHDFRHSHVSLLIELGFSPLLIAERLGHDDVKTTLNTYSHLYPNKQAQVSDKLEGLFCENSTNLVPNQTQK